jgi:hypothetical protein
MTRDRSSGTSGAGGDRASAAGTSGGQSGSALGGYDARAAPGGHGYRPPHEEVGGFAMFF